MDLFSLEEVCTVGDKSLISGSSNKQRILFDLEGTLSVKDGDILQIGAIVTDWDFNIKQVYNEYYQNNKPIGEKEFRIHNISQSFIDQVATRHFTEAVYDSPLNTNIPTMFMSYKTFDVRRVNEELAHYNLPLINFGAEKIDLNAPLKEGESCHFDAFALGRKRGSQVTSELGEDVMDSIFEELNQFGDFKKLTNHDALYDAAMILALCRRM